MQTLRSKLFPDLAAYLRDAQAELATIAAERRVGLEQLAGFIQARRRASGTVALVSICTHNSRRSQMAQIWARTAAHWFGVAGIEAYSGGTEATAFDPRAVAAVGRAGFVIEDPGSGENRVYRLWYADGVAPIECFSKVYAGPANPTEGFAAVMTCSVADVACPVVVGAAARISLPYDDPMIFDGTPQEAARYDDCCRRIAREMLYAFSRVPL